LTNLQRFLRALSQWSRHNKNMSQLKC
jgi:hypothetical protein